MLKLVPYGGTSQNTVFQPEDYTEWVFMLCWWILGMNQALNTWNCTWNQSRRGFSSWVYFGEVYFLEFMAGKWDLRMRILWNVGICTFGAIATFNHCLPHANRRKEPFFQLQIAFTHGPIACSFATRPFFQPEWRTQASVHLYWNPNCNGLWEMQRKFWSFFESVGL